MVAVRVSKDQRAATHLQVLDYPFYDWHILPNPARADTGEGQLRQVRDGARA